jgi:hypothetical protein
MYWQISRTRRYNRCNYSWWKDTSLSSVTSISHLDVLLWADKVTELYFSFFYSKFCSKMYLIVLQCFQLLELYPILVSILLHHYLNLIECMKQVEQIKARVNSKKENPPMKHWGDGVKWVMIGTILYRWCLSFTGNITIRIKNNMTIGERPVCDSCNQRATILYSTQEGNIILCRFLLF